MNHTEKTIPVWKKYSLNVSEAAEYYGIGEKLSLIHILIVAPGGVAIKRRLFTIVIPP